ncbi:MAG: DUF1501 domain-containing protein, partial [Candidatus Omnitrophica bacterium]|nr:DUF1501 domain-containing protein [Candidatus Omnitrophota bacterium]
MDPLMERMHGITRRHFLGQCKVGIGAVALSTLFGTKAIADIPDSDNPLAVRPPHFPAKAKNVIYLHMAGSPPQLDLFDYKPKLNELNGQPCPDSFLEKERFA